MQNNLAYAIPLSLYDASSIQTVADDVDDGIPETDPIGLAVRMPERPLVEALLSADQIGAPRGTVRFDFAKDPKLALNAGRVSDRLIAMAEWEGYVVSVNADERTFVARLFDVRTKERVQEEAEFLLDDVRPDDVDLAREGGIFRWVIGYRDRANGNRERITKIVFRRLPAWTRSDFEKASQEAARIANAIQWD